MRSSQAPGGQTPAGLHRGRQRGELHLGSEAHRPGVGEAEVRALARVEAGQRLVAHHVARLEVHDRLEDRVEGAGGQDVCHQVPQLHLPAHDVQPLRQQRAQGRAERDDAGHLLDEGPGEALVERPDEEDALDVVAMADRPEGERLDATRDCPGHPAVGWIFREVLRPGPRRRPRTHDRGAQRRQIRPHRHGIPGRGALGNDLDVAVAEEQLHRCRVHEGQHHELVADRLCSLRDARPSGIA